MEFTIVGYLILSALAAVFAANRGHSGLTFFILSVLLSPLIAFIIILVIKPNIQNINKLEFEQGISRKCPFCAETIKREAVICRFCHKELDRLEPIVNVPEMSNHKNDNMKNCPFCGFLNELGTDLCFDCQKPI